MEDGLKKNPTSVGAWHGEERRVVAALSYVGILFLIPLLIAKESEFAKFHVRQGIILFIIEVIISFSFFHRMTGTIISAVIFVACVVCVVQTLQGKKWELPLLGKYAQQIKL